MAFPTTATLDNGARANENPISNGGLWAMPILPGDYSAQLLSNVIQSAGTGWESAYISASKGPDCEIWGDLTATGTDFDLWWRVVNPNAAGISGYKARFQPVADTVLVYRVDSNVQTLLATISGTVNNSTRVGIDMIGTVIRAYANAVQIGSYDTNPDATKYSAAGKIGIGSFYNTGDGFTTVGGGTIAAAGGPPAGSRAMLGVGR